MAPPQTDRYYTNSLFRLHHASWYVSRDRPSEGRSFGKCVLITGASKGIGRATALSFARAGASGIAILARSDLSSLVDEIHTAAQRAGRTKPQVLPLTADQTSQAQVQAAATKLTSEFADSDVEDWWRTFEVDVKGVYLMDRAFIPLMLKGGDKTIIAATSYGAFAIAPGASAYQTTGSAIIHLNNFLVAEYGEQGLLVYTAHPGGILTELARNMPEYMYDRLQDTSELAGDTFVFLTREKRDWLNDRFVSMTWDMEELVAKKDQVLKDDLLRYQFRT